MKMQHTITINNQQIPLVVKKHATARRLIIRYQPLKKCVSLTLPKRVKLAQGLAFVQSKHEWIASQIAKFSPNYGDVEGYFADGGIIPILGENVIIKYVGGRGIANLADGILIIHGEQEFLQRRVRVWLRKKCANEINILTEKFRTQLGVKVQKITLRDTSSRWGSCSHNGNLSFSWRLIFAPKQVLEYVVAHEMAHLKEHNHSPAFWAVVAQICPDWKQHREWLKRNGRMLHRF